jgi:hypothetical protein
MQIRDSATVGRPVRACTTSVRGTILPPLKYGGRRLHLRLEQVADRSKICSEASHRRVYR